MNIWSPRKGLDGFFQLGMEENFVLLRLVQPTYEYYHLVATAYNRHPIETLVCATLIFDKMSNIDLI